MVDKLLTFIPLSDALLGQYRQKFIDYLSEKIRGFTDSLLESAEMALNRYTSAKPGQFSDVITLRDGSASYGELKARLLSLAHDRKIVDLFILTHGDVNVISVAGDIDGEKIRAMRTENGGPLTIRSVYMMNCVGASLNQAWLDAGAKASSGSIGINYFPEPTMYFFWNNWKEGQTFESAVTSAYRKTINLINDVIRGFIIALPIPGTSLIGSRRSMLQTSILSETARR